MHGEKFEYSFKERNACDNEKTKILIFKNP